MATDAQQMAPPQVEHTSIVTYGTPAPGGVAQPLPAENVYRAPQTAQAAVTQVTTATAPDRATAVAAVDQAVVGGLVGQAEAALAGQPAALITGAAAVLAYVGICFGAILVCALAGSRIAQTYIAAIFAANSVWIVVAAILVGGAFLARSPIKSQQGG